MALAPEGPQEDYCVMPDGRGLAAQVLTRSGWLSRCPTAFQEEVLARATVLRVAAGRHVYMTGDPVGGIYGLVSGTLAVSIAPGETGPHLVHLAAPGWWFGEGCFLTGAPRRIGLQAVTGCTVATLALAEMEGLSAKDPASIRRFAGIAMLHIDLALLAIEDLLRPDAVRRIAAVLWRGSGGQSGYRLPVTQVALRQLSNASRKETLAALRLLDELGAVRRGYGVLEVLDAQRLRSLADGEGPLPPTSGGALA